MAKHAVERRWHDLRDLQIDASIDAFHKIDANTHSRNTPFHWARFRVLWCRGERFDKAARGCSAGMGKGQPADLSDL